MKMIARSKHRMMRSHITKRDGARQSSAGRQGQPAAQPRLGLRLPLAPSTDGLSDANLPRGQVRGSTVGECLTGQLQTEKLVDE